MAAAPAQNTRSKAVQGRIDLVQQKLVAGSAATAGQLEAGKLLGEAAASLVEIVERVEGHDVGRLIAALDFLDSARHAADASMLLAAPPARK